MSNMKVTMNKELQEWINESKEEMRTIRAKNSKLKKPSGKCQICGEKTATTVCLKCGKSVCKACHFKIIGVCKKCIPPEIAGKWDGSKIDWERELGVDWVD